MFTLPIQSGWYHMILHGYKKEEYRDIKPYYTIRFKKLFGCERLSEKEFINLINEDKDGRFTAELILRNGYRKESPSAKVNATLRAGVGNPDWGAEKDTPYYILTINSITELVPVKEQEG